MVACGGEFVWGFFAPGVESSRAATGEDGGVLSNFSPEEYERAMLLLLSACAGRQLVVPPDNQFVGWRQWITDRPSESYQETCARDGGAQDTTEVAVTRFVEQGDGEVRFREEVRSVFDGEQTLWVAWTTLLDSGMWVVQEKQYDGRVIVQENPKLIFPANPRPGLTWTGHHVGRLGPIERSCEMRADDTHCVGGLSVTCRTTMMDAEGMAREHYCPYVGWVGAESLVERTGKAPYRCEIGEVKVPGAPPRPPPRREPLTVSDVRHPRPSGGG